MRLFKRRSQEKAELPCPRCKTLVPVGDDICNVCGWDMLDQYKPPDPRVSPATKLHNARLTAVVLPGALVVITVTIR